MFTLVFNTYLQPKAIDMQYFHGERTKFVQPFNLDGYGTKRKPGVTTQLGLPGIFVSATVRTFIWGVQSSLWCKLQTVLQKFYHLDQSFIWWNRTAVHKCSARWRYWICCFKPFPTSELFGLFSNTSSNVEYHKQIHRKYKHHSTIKFLSIRCCDIFIKSLSR